MSVIARLLIVQISTSLTTGAPAYCNYTLEQGRRESRGALGKSFHARIEACKNFFRVNQVGSTRALWDKCTAYRSSYSNTKTYDKMVNYIVTKVYNLIINATSVGGLFYLPCSLLISYTCTPTWEREGERDVSVTLLKSCVGMLLW